MYNINRPIYHITSTVELPLEYDMYWYHGAGYFKFVVTLNL